MILTSTRLSKVLQYFGNVSHNLADPDAFAEVTRLDELHWTMRWQAHLIHAGFVFMAWGMLLEIYDLTW